MGKEKALGESLRVGHKTCDAALDAFNRLESLLHAIDRLADEPCNVGTISGLATIGLEIAQNMSNLVDNALMKMEVSEAELRSAV